MCHIPHDCFAHGHAFLRRHENPLNDCFENDEYMREEGMADYVECRTVLPWNYPSVVERRIVRRTRRTDTPDPYLERINLILRRVRAGPWEFRREAASARFALSGLPFYPPDHAATGSQTVQYVRIPETPPEVTTGDTSPGDNNEMSGVAFGRRPRVANNLKRAWTL